MTTDQPHNSSSVDLEYLRKTVEMVGYLQKTHCEQLFSEIARLQADLEHTRQIVGDAQVNANMHRELAAIVARDLQEARQIVTAQQAVIEAVRVLQQPEARGFSAALGEYVIWGAVQFVLDALARLDAADGPRE